MERFSILCIFAPTGFENNLSSGKRGAGLDSPFATIHLIAFPDSSSLLAVTPSIVLDLCFKIVSSGLMIILRFSLFQLVDDSLSKIKRFKE